MKWDKLRIKSASIGVRIGAYKALPANDIEKKQLEAHPEIMFFNAISIGDDDGQAFIVPLDDSDRETAEYILRALKAYTGD